jgi:hypothetical protein
MYEEFFQPIWQALSPPLLVPVIVTSLIAAIIISLAGRAWRLALDGASKLMKRSALRRAEEIAKGYEELWRQYTDVRQLILEGERRSAYVTGCYGFTAVVMLGLLGYQLSGATAPDMEPARTLSFNSMLVTSAMLFGGFMLTLVTALGRIKKQFREFPAYREQVISRIRGQLKAAKLSEQEIEDWLRRIPPVPMPAGISLNVPHHASTQEAAALPAGKPAGT